MPRRRKVRRPREAYAITLKIPFAVSLKRPKSFRTETQLRNAIKRLSVGLMSSGILKIRFMRVRGLPGEDVASARKARLVLDKFVEEKPINWRELNFLTEQLLHAFWYQDMIVEDVKSRVDKKLGE